MILSDAIILACRQNCAFARISWGEGWYAYFSSDNRGWVSREGVCASEPLQSKCGLTAETLLGNDWILVDSHTYDGKPRGLSAQESQEDEPPEVPKEDLLKYDLEEEAGKDFGDPQLHKDLTYVMNGWENGSNTPDFLLADFLIECFYAFEKTSRAREDWYGYPHVPGVGSTATDPNALDLLDCAETLLCNSRAGRDHTPEVWDGAVRKWMDAKHKVCRVGLDSTLGKKA